MKEIINQKGFIMKKEYKKLFAELYQICAALNCNDQILDNLSAASREPSVPLPHKTLLPFYSDKLSIPLEAGAVLPTIDVDKLAIRFTFTDESGCNLFWSDLFIGQRHENFHIEIMRNIHRIYNECVENNIHPRLEDEAT